MRILVTGYKGFIGQNVVKKLGTAYELSLYEWGDGVVDLDGVEFVIHLGAISATTCTDEKALKEQNVDFTTALVDRCVAKDIPIQIASSASVYGINNKTFRETDAVDPCNLYAKSKVAVEEYCKPLLSKARIQIFRYFNVYGQYEDHKKEQASPYHKFKKQKEKTGTINLFKGSQYYYRDFVPVEQIIKTHRRFFDVEESGIWNVGTGKPKSFYEVATEIGGNINWVDMPSELKQSYQKYTCADLSKLNKTLNGDG